jgi:hypothetical protein
MATTSSSIRLKAVRWLPSLLGIGGGAGLLMIPVSQEQEM